MKSQVRVFIASALLIGLAALAVSLVSAQSQQAMSGYLFSKLSGIGTRSEGPIYFLQKLDGTEIQIRKQTMIFQDDAKLRAHIGTKITVVGTMTGNALSYISIETCPPSTKGCETQWGR